MSVIVATAYMEEAERFDWLVAMNAGKVLAAGAPAELKAQTRRATHRGGLHRAAAGGSGAGRKPLEIPPRAVARRRAGDRRRAT